MTGPGHRIWDTAPADGWQDAFLAGNGEYGIMVHGEPYAERILVNHHRFVLPNGTHDARPPQLAARLPRIRRLILTDRRAEASRLLAGDGVLRWTQSFHPGFALTVAGTGGPVRDYHRHTDFDTGEIVVRWAGGTRRCFVSRADRLVVTHLDMGACEVGATGELPGRPAEVRYAVSAYRHDGLVFLRVRGRYPRLGRAYGVEGLTLLRGDVEVDGDRVLVRGPALLLTVLHRPASRWRTEALARRLTGHRDTRYGDLLARHVTRHAPAYRRVSLELDVPAAHRALPVGELLARQAATPHRLEPALLERLFHAGRYLLFSASGVLPPRLTGLWLGSWDAAWAGDFTTDANLNLQLAAANIGALPEVTAAHARLVRAQVAHWRHNARAIYGARGLLAPSRTDGEHGHLFHLHPGWPFTAWLPGAHWLLFPLYEQHLVTGKPLGEVAGWLVEAAEFLADVLTVTGENGALGFVPSYSAETGPLDAAGTAVPVAVNATMDIAAARHAFTVAAALTGEDRWAQLAARLPAYRVDADGALAEWAWPGYRADEDHRHISHLYPVWPLGEINPDDTPELATAAHRALRRRGDENLSAHGSLHRALAAARLHDGPLVEANLLKIVGGDMFFRSLMSAHNPGRVTYNADAAHALPAVLIESLVQGRPGRLRLLPAALPGLTRGTLRGVTCPGRVVVAELTWRPGTVRARLASPVAQRLRVCGPYGETEVRLVAGETTEVTFARRGAH
ncbi:glycoside hydrolase N-terminal domain-containing protein [Micromonospora sp. WMMD1082]|uniref:glycosyl hydrolase family 95 catalytic domain-containing protein n=1 Tax=Micromonospora sp. WMMD1082 TaxID=3016104 RepID=UPI0024178BF2|nr:glycoside hydrolase N-terminal domain-containing protein [Micromonospora sp. WMMD1082]MDG4797746.1 glycoside hydrolase N-terminal domain-containing protein [Micromonospora sp. WMMD1082]